MPQCLALLLCNLLPSLEVRQENVRRLAIAPFPNSYLSPTGQPPYDAANPTHRYALLHLQAFMRIGEASHLDYCSCCGSLLTCVQCYRLHDSGLAARMKSSETLQELLTWLVKVGTCRSN